MQVIKKQTSLTAVQFNKPGDCADIVYYMCRAGKALERWINCDMGDEGAQPCVDIGSRWFFVMEGNWILTDPNGERIIMSNERFLNEYESIKENV